MRAFVTGIEGFVGHYLARELEAGGHRIAGSYWDRGTAADLPASYRLFPVDLRDELQVIAGIAEAQPELVFHLAAQSSAGLSFTRVKETFEINLIGTVNLLEALRRLDTRPRLVLVSSCEVYGPNRDGRPTAEDQPYDPVNPYGSSKVAQELACRQYHRSFGLDLVTARPYPHTGPGHSTTFALPSFARQIAEIERGLRPPVIKVGNLSVTRDLSDVRDVVRAYRLLAEAGEAGQAYNVCSGRAITMDACLRHLLSLSDRKIAIEVDQQFLRPVDIPVLWGDNRKLAERTGWQPSRTAEETLAWLLDHWRSNTKELEKGGEGSRA